MNRARLFSSPTPPSGTHYHLDERKQSPKLSRPPVPAPKAMIFDEESCRALIEIPAQSVSLSSVSSRWKNETSTPPPPHTATIMTRSIRYIIVFFTIIMIIVLLLILFVFILGLHRNIYRQHNDHHMHKCDHRHHCNRTSLLDRNENHTDHMDIIIALNTTTATTNIVDIREKEQVDEVEIDEDEDDFRLNAYRRQFIKNMTLDAWRAYRAVAFGEDALRPVSRRAAKYSFGEQTGYTIVNALSTLHVMQLWNEYRDAKRWIAQNLTLSSSTKFVDDVPVYLAEIGYIGGLLACYALEVVREDREMFRRKAIAFADALTYAYQTVSGISADIGNLRDTFSSGQLSSSATLPERTASILEYTYLNHIVRTTDSNIITNENNNNNSNSSSSIAKSYEQRIDAILRFLRTQQNLSKFLNSEIDTHTGKWAADAKPLAPSSSMYSHLIKRYLMKSKQEDADDGEDVDQSFLLQTYQRLIRNSERYSMFAYDESVDEQLFVRSRHVISLNDSDGDQDGSASVDREIVFDKWMPSKGCSLAGALALGSVALQRREAEKRRRAATTKFDSRHNHNFDHLPSDTCLAAHYMRLAQMLTDTCFRAANRTKTGLPPRIMFFDLDDYERRYYFDDATRRADSQKLVLSPELAESYFILWRTTHDRKYREYAWQLATKIREHCQVSSSDSSSGGGGGYSNLADVDRLPAPKIDYQNAHFISGTLKYLYLIFASDDVFPLDRWIFNDAGHPFPVL